MKSMLDVGRDWLGIKCRSDVEGNMRTATFWFHPVRLGTWFSFDCRFHRVASVQRFTDAQNFQKLWCGINQTGWDSLQFFQRWLEEQIQIFRFYFYFLFGWGWLSAVEEWLRTQLGPTSAFFLLLLLLLLALLPVLLLLLLLLLLELVKVLLFCDCGMT